MSIDLQLPTLTELKPRITVIGVGGGGGNAVNNMIASGLDGVHFVVANTDAQALVSSSAEHRVQLGVNVTEGLGAGSRPEIGEAAAEEALDDIRAHVAGCHMVFVAAGMGGGTGTGAISVIARVAKEMGILVVGVVTKPFQFEGSRRSRIAEAGIVELRQFVDTLIVIPNQNLFRIANDKTTFAEAFILADQVLYSGIACIVDLIVKDGLINLDFADVRTVMSGMGAAMMGTGEASGEGRAVAAAEEAIANPLLDDLSLRGARGLLLSIIGGHDLTLYEVDEAASRVREEVDPDANIIVGATFDDTLGDRVRVSIVASGMSAGSISVAQSADQNAMRPAVGDPGLAQSAPAETGVTDAQPSAAQAACSAEQIPEQAVAAAPEGGRMAEKLSKFLSKTSQAPVAQSAEPPLADRHVTPDDDSWDHGNEVIIEDRAPQLMRATMRDPGLDMQAQAAHVAETAAPAFVAAAPHAVPRQPNQMPPLSEFPVVGQRDFRANAGGQHGEPVGQYTGQDTAGAAHRHVQATQSPAADPPRKRGFFERLTGRARQDTRDAPVNRHEDFQAERLTSGNQPHAGPRRQSAEDPQDGPQSLELPTFFQRPHRS